MYALVSINDFLVFKFFVMSIFITTVYKYINKNTKYLQI